MSIETGKFAVTTFQYTSKTALHSGNLIEIKGLSIL